MLTTAEEFVPKVGMGVKGGSWEEEGTPVEQTYQQKKMYDCVPYIEGPVGFVEDWIKELL